MTYAELHCITNYSFLRGASRPEELVQRAAQLKYAALAITDECSLAGVVRAHIAAKEHDIKLIIGSEFTLDDGTRFILLATDRSSYGHLSHLITQARRNAEKGQYLLTRAMLQQYYPAGCLVLWLPPTTISNGTQYSHAPSQLEWLIPLFPQALWIAVELHLSGEDHLHLQRLNELGTQFNIPLCACGDVHMHIRQRRAVQDTLTAIRHNTPISELGLILFPNAERYLRSERKLKMIYPQALLDETLRIAALCNFSLDELRYEYPDELVPAGHTPTSWLTTLTEQGMQQRWPHGTPAKVKQLVQHELNLIQELRYEHYFLTVHDIVRYARSQNILCQGRGSAANSAVCYCLGITEVDPERMQLLFERFISKERNEPPDIDVDFEHERREEVIQYIYRKYGRERAALAATVITYQPRSAVRDVGKALGMSLDQIDRLAKSIYWWDKPQNIDQQLKEAGFSPDQPLIKRLVKLVFQLLGFPRHLSQHVGGFVISHGRLSHLVPIENAAMAERTVIQWEKDDLEALGLMKIDLLALGMLSAIRKALQYISGYTRKTMTLANIPAEDPNVYALIQQADTIGVFQIESRAQMSMLPRLRPENYYDLVIEIAIIRPGPIQGDMVHPYLMRRKGLEEVTYPSDAVRHVLHRTLGVPIFQEQVMQLAMVAAGFSAGEADKLRRSMAAWKRRGGLEPFEEKLLSGMTARGYSEEFAQKIFRQIKGFGEYGFPESHSASFALLAYTSSWLKRYHPAAFTCALLNSQPMGFYAPAQLVQDAQRHAVSVLPVDINKSEYDCTLEFPDDTAHKQHAPALRLGFRMVKHLSVNGIDAIIQARQHGAYKNTQDLATRTHLNKTDLEALAAAGALQGIAQDRHRAYWQVAGVEHDLPLFNEAISNTPIFNETDVLLRKPGEGENIIADYAHVGLTLQRHPLALLRKRLHAKNVYTAQAIWDLPNDTHAKVAGLVVNRQRPGSAAGVIFMTLEDETGYANVIVWPTLVEKQRRVLLQSQLIVVTGLIQQEDGVLHVIAKRLEDYTYLLGELKTTSRNFH